MSSKPSISVSGLSKCYTISHRGDPITTAGEALARRLKNPFTRETKEQFWALQDISFQLNKGDVVGVIGRNGAGKSTLLKTLSRITEPTTGEIVLRGRVGSLLEVGTGFHPELTGRENVYMNGAILGMKRSEIERQFDAIVDFSGTEKFLDTPVKRYSSGMYVRLAFAVAAHLNPDILIVDEVLAVGDAQFQKKCLGKMSDISREEGRTILFVSHNIGAVHSLCNRAFLLKGGRLIMDDTVDEVVTEYYAHTQNAERDNYSGPIKSVEILNANHESSHRFEYGDTVIIAITIDGGKDGIRLPEVGVGVNTIFNQRVFTVGTFFSSDRLPDIEGKVTIYCEMKNIFLAPGTYNMKVNLSTLRQGNDVDTLNEVCEFEVLPTDVFGSGNLPGPSQGNVISRSRWSVADRPHETPVRELREETLMGRANR